MRRNRDYLVDAKVIVHVSNAGVNNLRIFSGRQQCNYFTELLRQALENMPVSLLMHVLLPEQFQMALEQLDHRSEILVDRSVIWALVGGPGGYARFIESYDPADPRSAKEFLQPGALDFWRKRGLIARPGGKK